MANRIRLKAAVKTREGRIIVPGVYDKEDPSFPECLLNEDRDFLVEFLDPQPETAVEEEDEFSSDEEPEEDETEEDESSSDATPKKKKKKKRA